jgi:hypothetical protein
MAETNPEEARLTAGIHRGCGGAVASSLDGEFCTACKLELREDEIYEPVLYTDADRSYDLWAFGQDYGSAP